MLHEGLIGVIGRGRPAGDRLFGCRGHPRSWRCRRQPRAGWASPTSTGRQRSCRRRARALKPALPNFTDGRARYQSDFRTDTQTIAPGGSVTSQTLVFAGAKQVPIIDGYEEQYNILNFDLMIDWGWFYFITKPMFWLIDYLFKVFGNFGIAILATTVVVKLIFFPLANKSYVSMANMKKVAAQARGAQGQAWRRQDGSAEGHDGALQAGEDQPGGRLLAGSVADPGVLCALQGALCHHRNAPCAVLRLDPGPLGARSDLHLQPVRPAPL